jgi:hypothetical protein
MYAYTGEYHYKVLVSLMRDLLRKMTMKKWPQKFEGSVVAKSQHQTFFICRDQYTACLPHLCHDSAVRFAATLPWDLPRLCRVIKPSFAANLLHSCREIWREFPRTFKANFTGSLGTRLLVNWHKLAAYLMLHCCIVDANMVGFWREFDTIVLLVSRNRPCMLTRCCRDIATRLPDIWRDYDDILTWLCCIIDVYLQRPWRAFWREVDAIF